MASGDLWRLTLSFNSKQVLACAIP